ncbi:MAG: RluA family pseudouridine synthase [Phycisphaerales bacterium]|nr:RluA family pseudouridine synthase [Phycisphaerales bacterium]
MPDFAIKPNPAVLVPVLHEDNDLLIINKPAGTVTQPGKGHAFDSLLNGVFALHDGLIAKLLHNLGQRRDFGLLHRLDKETSGLLVIAKTPNAYDQLRRDFEARRVDKEYFALTAGIPHPKQGVIQARLKEIEVPNPDAKREGASIKKVVISRQGQEAISAYKVLSQTPENKPPAALVNVAIKTGRLHQIRAHMTFIHCQVLGDDIYSVPHSEIENRKSKIENQNYPPPPRLCLHAAHLGFKHPATHQWVHFRTPLPPDLATYAAKLGLCHEHLVPRP